MMSCGKGDNSSLSNSVSNMNSATAVKRRSDAAKNLLNTISREESFLYTCEEVSESTTNKSLQTLSKIYTYKIDECSDILNFVKLCQDDLIIRERTVLADKSVEQRIWKFEVDRSQDVSERDFRLTLDLNNQADGIEFFNIEQRNTELARFRTDTNRTNYKRYCEDRL